MSRFTARTTIQTFQMARRDTVRINMVLCSLVPIEAAKNSIQPWRANFQFIRLSHMALGDPKLHSLASILTTSRTPAPASVEIGTQPSSAISTPLTTSQSTYSRAPSSLMYTTKLLPISTIQIPVGPTRLTALNGHAQRQRMSSSSSKVPLMTVVSDLSTRFQASRLSRTSRMLSEGTPAAS